MAAQGSRLPTKKETAIINDAIEMWRNNFLKGVQAICGINVPEQIMFFSAIHDMNIAAYMLDPEKINAWSGKKHVITNLYGKKSFQHDFMIAAGANYIVK